MPFVLAVLAGLAASAIVAVLTGTAWAILALLVIGVIVREGTLPEKNSHGYGVFEVGLTAILAAMFGYGGYNMITAIGSDLAWLGWVFVVFAACAPFRILRTIRETPPSVRSLARQLQGKD